MPLFGSAAASEPCIIVWHSSVKNRIVGVEFETLGDAEDAWSSPRLLFTSCVLFIQRPSDSVWIAWRSYGIPSQIQQIERDFANPEIRQFLFEDIDNQHQGQASPVRASAVHHNPIQQQQQGTPVVFTNAPSSASDATDEVTVLPVATPISLNYR
uniref:Uncharacterized protein n=1 Tax=Aureoumbra lagunensis TaxID=44058 RepID=A0A6S8CBD5_9STRA